MNRRPLPAILLLLATGSLAAGEPSVTYLPERSSERIPLNTVAPVYPAIARRDRVEGDVQVCFNVDREGRPYRIAVRSSTDRIFEKPSIRAIRTSRYVEWPPGMEVPAIKTCRTFRYRLEPVVSTRNGSSRSES